MSKHWLFNNEGLEWWHILIVIGLFVGIFLLPLRTEKLTISNVNWYFVDAANNKIDPTTVNVYGGFGVTNDPKKLEVANLVGTSVMIHPPYGPESGYGMGKVVATVVEFPKSKITLLHQNNCPPSTQNDGVDVTTNDGTETLNMHGKEYITDFVKVSGRAYPNCDWVWFQGQRQISFIEWFYDDFIKKKQTIIPAQPFAVISLG